MTRDVDAIRADLAARTVGGMASSAADRDISALLAEVDRLRAECFQYALKRAEMTLGAATVLSEGTP